MLQSWGGKVVVVMLNFDNDDGSGDDDGSD